MTAYISEIWATLARFTGSYGLQLLGALAIVIVGWVLSRWAARAARRYVEKSSTLGPTLAPVSSKFARVTVLVLVAVAVLDKLGVDTTSLLAALGAMGLAVGLALKDTLTDIASGIEVLVLRPFEVGDDVDVDGVEGKVERVDVFQTMLVATDGIPVILPNRRLRTGRIRNFTRAKRRRIEVGVGIAYDADVDEARVALLAVMTSHDKVLGDPAPIIDVLELADSSVNLVCRVWIEPKDWFATRLDLTRRMKLALDDVGIVIPFPQREVYMVEKGAAKAA